MADIGEPLRRVKILPTTEPIREPERQMPVPNREPAQPVREPEKVE